MFIGNNFRGCRNLDDKQALFDTIRQLLVDRFGLQEADISEDLKFEDIGADSLDMIELMMELESKYNIQFSQESIKEIKTIGQAVTYLEELK